MNKHIYRECIEFEAEVRDTCIPQSMGTLYAFVGLQNLSDLLPGNNIQIVLDVYKTSCLENFG